MTKQNLVKPRTLSGFAEFLPNEQIAFNRILDAIRRSYEQYAFTPLDTPVLELSEVLLAKAGGETEKQIYSFQKGDHNLSMRFDLTVPLAKYVAMHAGQLTFPFRRYQIGKVYRGERPQKGRYREFYQADVDIIGNGHLSLYHDAEIIGVIYTTLTAVGLPAFTIHVNNRKVLSGFFAALNLTEQITDILRVIDKIAKIGADNVRAELVDLGLNEAQCNQVMAFIQTSGSNVAKIEALERMNVDSDTFKEGVQELKTVVESAVLAGVPAEVIDVDLCIARGLDYYTGTVYETTINDYPQIGSICSGGRYENLAGYYTSQKLPGVGVSIGVTRLFSQLMEHKLIDVEKETMRRVLIVPMDELQMEPAFKCAGVFRAKGIPTEVFVEKTKFKNKMAYADKMHIPFVAIIGEEEAANGMVALKNMNAREQVVVSPDEAVILLKEKGLF